MTAYAFALAPVISLADDAVLGRLGGGTGRYGRIRVWGAVGWGVTAPVVGLLVERWGLGAAFASYQLLMGVPLSSSCSCSAAPCPRGWAPAASCCRQAGEARGRLRRRLG